MITSTLTESAPPEHPIRALTRAATTQADSNAQPPMSRETAQRLTNMVARYIAFVPTERDPRDEHPGHRCQLGTSELRQEEAIGENGETKIITTTIFVLKAWGRTWSEAVAMWKGRAK